MTKFCRYIAAPLTYIGIAALVISGGHYTMDVLIAYWLTSHIFYAYHQVFQMPRFVLDSFCKNLNRIFLYNFVDRSNSVIFEYWEKCICWKRLANPVFCFFLDLQCHHFFIHYTCELWVVFWNGIWEFCDFDTLRFFRVERTKAPLSHLWWFWLCYWFESDVPDGALRNEWDWPLPGPICVHHFVQRISDKLQ